MSTIWCKIVPMNSEVVRTWANQKFGSSPVSMRKLAEKMDISHAKISRMLSGKQDADFSFYLEFARAFDAVPEFLRVADILPDEDEEGALFGEILAAMKALTIEEREEVLQYVFFVKEKRDRHGLGREATAPT